MLDRIEVMKGPASVLYGNASPGGIVNMISKNHRKPNTDVEFDTGSDNRREGKIDSTGQIGDSDVSYRFVGLAGAVDGQAEGSKDERYLLAPSLRWDIDDNNSLLLQAFFQNDPNAGVIPLCQAKAPSSILLMANCRLTFIWAITIGKPISVNKNLSATSSITASAMSGLSRRKPALCISRPIRKTPTAPVLLMMAALSVVVCT